MRRLLISILAIVCSAGPAMAAARPNIVWIFSDDHSFQTIGAYGGRLAGLNPTPNIDRLAKEGMRFDRCYVGNSICGPSRATLLTGLHTHLHGKIDNEVPFDHDQQQFQKILRTSGYQTALIGKIHIDGKLQGFDHWEVLPGQGAYRDPVFVGENGRHSTKGHVTDLITQKSLKWLDSQRDPAKPFMLMIHHKAPHRPWLPAARHMPLYEDVTIPEPPNLFDDYATRTTAAREQDMTIAKTMELLSDLKVGPRYAKPGNPFLKRNQWFEAHQPKGRELVSWKYQTYMKDFLRCVAGVDESVGSVLDYLKTHGLEENTAVFYSSDQGFYMGEHGWFDKRFMYEESFRTPLIARWPGHIQPGAVNRDLVQNIDFAETFLDLANAPVPDTMQGRSLLPLLRGETPADWRRTLYYHYYEFPKPHHVRPHEGVSDARHKLIRFYGPGIPGGEEWELYNLEKDPSEMNNIAAEPDSREIITHLRQELARLRELYKVPGTAKSPGE